jgi:hypothetical protein
VVAPLVDVELLVLLSMQVDGREAVAVKDMVW